MPSAATYTTGYPLAGYSTGGYTTTGYTTGVTGVPLTTGAYQTTYGGTVPYGEQVTYVTGGSGVRGLGENVTYTTTNYPQTFVSGGSGVRAGETVTYTTSY